MKINIFRFGRYVASVSSREAMKQWIVDNVPTTTSDGLIPPTRRVEECERLAKSKHYSFELEGEGLTAKSIDRLSAVLATAKFPDIAQEDVIVKEKGRNYTCNCPICGAENSMVLLPRQGAYKCFACGEMGNAVTYIMKVKDKTYEQALTYLENKYIKSK